MLLFGLNGQSEVNFSSSTVLMFVINFAARKPK